MFRLTIVVIIGAVLFLGSSASAQDAGQRSQYLAASLDKNKYKKKEKRGFSIEFYVDIKNAPVVKADPAGYSGRYGADGYLLDLQVASSGTAAGSGYETRMGSGRPEQFTLRDARVDGSLLTAVRVYEGGETRPLEAVFVDRTVSTGKNANSIESSNVSFGLGYVQTGSGGAGSYDNNWSIRVFMEKR
jgi:hypothetical protein